MKTFFKVLFFTLLLALSNTPQLFAAVDRFEVVLGQESAKVWEALDLTITAVDRDGNIEKNYLWDILVFSESDPTAEFPTVLSENSYKFIEANEGSMKFENAVIFKKPWVQNLYVYDLNQETVMGLAEVTISEEVKLKNIDIEILSPENGLTLWKNTLTISWTTQKNYQVRITVNAKQELMTTSNEEGVFEQIVENLVQGENTFQARVLDADGNIIGESKVVKVQVNSLAPEFKSISITPTGEVEAESPIDIEVVSNIWLREVQVIINEVITKLTEVRDGRYTGKSFAPGLAGEYPVDVILKNDFNIETKEEAVETLTIIAKPELEAAPKETVIETIPTRTNTPTENLDLTIKNIKVTELKERSIITWDALLDAESYNIYKKISDTQVELIDNVKEARYEIAFTGDKIKYEEFAIKALGKTSTGTLVQWDLSDMTRVQTGPILYILLGFIALMLSGGIFFLGSRKAA